MIRNIKDYCCEDISLIENYEEAVNDKTQTWHCHHRFETEFNLSAKELSKMNMYYDRPADELIFLTHGEHSRLHNKQRPREMFATTKGRHLSDEHKAKISVSSKGRKVTSETRAKLSAALKGRTAPNKGKPMSDEQKKKLSTAMKNLSPETRAKMADGRRGKKLSQAAKAKISAKAKGRIPWNLGKKMPEGTGAKISAKLKGRKYKQLSAEVKLKISIAVKAAKQAKRLQIA